MKRSQGSKKCGHRSKLKRKECNKRREKKISNRRTEASGVAKAHRLSSGGSSSGKGTSNSSGGIQENTSGHIISS